ncbi:hypothetical protein SERLA73DRAFT_74118 [Serpula lacrymans var. lacrymans S7.3]|uniref:Carboxylic ester hydrolase n=2 Tax=Serpula lacrymans var. lacrymans TaxID=341189 RepID=F8Q0N4_SERL3|nr:uncharacterized protein SERLADRAFT_438756 [Serpula lacrymans var. lacrymans S7.9]EGN97863.1 hypothetical protein SERLA73DRAFT_74118 [Serpula lacrymans var. lacrymans S7.3]EGO23445.1 hypothetical protein SERLADRAFT_438756 [Serpula lacrymans var. lacrymans S7.9]
MLRSILFVGLLFGFGVDASGALTQPTVNLDNATFTGITVGNFSKFLGIRFAQPPIGDYRFQIPQPYPAYTGMHNVTLYGPACPQQNPSNATIKHDVCTCFPHLCESFPIPPPTTDWLSEDCLYINVIRPAGATSSSKLPVLVQLYGGGFETGIAENNDEGSVIVLNRAIELEKPVVYVSMNYRLNAFGFLASQEVKNEGVGNLGLRDQREGLRWIQKYISAFGGDPTKVTLWGQSAGAISISFQMLTNGGNTEGLFHGAFMHSGAPMPVGDITNGQPYYDALVGETGCSGASDTLQCLRNVPYDDIMMAVNKSPNLESYQALALAWAPRADGDFLVDHPQLLVQNGSVADIPFVSSNCDDEGTDFSFSTCNVTTDGQFRDYLSTYWIKGAPDENMTTLLQQYPQDPTEGSPFDTGNNNTLTSQFKRVAAFQGDVVFQAPRRFLLHQRSDEQNTWSYLSKLNKTALYLGSSHGSDIRSLIGPGDTPMADYLINFVANLDPNGGANPEWPRYTKESPNLLMMSDGPTFGNIQINFTQDTYRTDPMEVLTSLSLAYPL